MSAGNEDLAYNQKFGFFPHIHVVLFVWQVKCTSFVTGNPAQLQEFYISSLRDAPETLYNFQHTVNRAFDTFSLNHSQSL